MTREGLKALFLMTLLKDCKTDEERTAKIEAFKKQNQHILDAHQKAQEGK